MKPSFYLLLIIAFAGLLTSCNKVSYHKTKSGLLYKIIPGNSKDSVKLGQWLKLSVVQTRTTPDNKDSVLQTTYGKMPAYVQINAPMADRSNYGPEEVLHLLKKGDSALIVMFIDSLFSKKLVTDEMQVAPLKKGDKLVIGLKVLDVFTSDSLYSADRNKEMEKYRPQMEKERAEQMEKQQKVMAEQMKMMKEQRDREIEEMEKSGEAAKQRKVVEDYLKAKNITAQKTGKGTYVVITQHGNGPQAAMGKYLNVKYTGYRLADPGKSFESNTYPLHLGVDQVIDGWNEGLQLFKQGDKGTIYIPAYLAYGKTPREGGPIKADDALIFDIEMLSVSDTPPAGAQQPQY
jgi:FKBP-type peptidyl-prolyl cis-trans isomerase FkpA